MTRLPSSRMNNLPGGWLVVSDCQSVALSLIRSNHRTRSRSPYKREYFLSADHIQWPDFLLGIPWGHVVAEIVARASTLGWEVACLVWMPSLPVGPQLVNEAVVQEEDGVVRGGHWLH